MEIEEQLLNEYEELTKRDTYKMNLVKQEVSILDDKVGGIPYLPVGEAYPVDTNGNKMALLMQVNLKNLSLENFPKEGILEVFFSTDDMVYDYNKMKDNIIIKIYEDNLEYQKDLEFIKFTGMGGTYKMNLEKVQTVRSFNDEDGCVKVLEDLIKKYNSEDYPGNYQDQIDAMSYVGSHIGGYVNLSYYDNGQELVSNDDECLFYINTDNFEDMGAIYAMYITINRDKIKNGDLSEFYFSYSFD